ncbi:DNA-binding protein [Oceanobacillus zhaokaii]|uniref:DNA-binding protein n=1 Tax=Oceanobacillus zhaokaii TaxID=2052660 RepID=A0A345PEK5_9BACI|nr:helix-turn-helix domain-containing protein [Oceanobacillus zhaokaii]AXI08435.1 DNA-binding protein [Oceanobacillus zhaokaii]
MQKRLSDYPDILNVEDVQAILGIGRKQAYDLVNSKSFHSLKIGKRIKISKVVLEDWIKGCVITHED